MKPAKQTDETHTVEMYLTQRYPDPNRLIRLKEVLNIVPVAASTWWSWVACGKAPAPVRLGTRCTCWRYSDVIALGNGVEA